MIPKQIKLKSGSSLIELQYDDDCYELSFEFLRVHSPSAEVRGHGSLGAVLQHGKAGVRVVNIEPVGNYAIKLVFSDAHDSGLYSWTLLRELSLNRDQLWQRYLEQLALEGKSRQA